MTPEQIKQIAIEECVWPSREVERQRFIKAAKRIAQMQREIDCAAIDTIDDGEAPEYRACQEAIRNNTGE